MRPCVLVLVTALAAFASADPPQEAAEAVLAAFRAGGDLRDLAARDQPDPWLVADELLRRGEADAAEAFAKAAPRPDTEKLPDYVTARRATPTDPRLRDAVAALNRALADGKGDEALALIEAAEPGDADVASVRLLFGRGLATRAVGRLEDSSVRFLEAAEAAERLGWLTRASSALYESGQSASSRGDSRGALEAWERRLALAERRESRAEAADALVNIGLVHFALADYPKAIEHQERARKLMADSGDRQGLAATLLNIGNVHYLLADYPKALEYYERVLRLSEEIDDRKRIAQALASIGFANRDLGDYPKALAFLERALKVGEEAGDREAIAMALVNIGLVHWSLGDYPEALKCYERALKSMDEAGDREGIARTLANIANIHDSLGDRRRALEYYMRALGLLEEIDDRHGIARALANIGSVHQSLGDYPEALDFLERTLKLMTESGDRQGVATTLVNIGSVHYALGDYPKALGYYERAMKLSEEIGDRAGVASALLNIGLVHLFPADYPKALEYCERALKLKEAVGDRAGVASALLSIGDVHSSLGDYAKALEYYERAMKLSEEIGDRAGIASALVSIGTVHKSLADYPKALEYQERARKLMADSGNRRGVATTLVNIGGVHDALADYPKALEYYGRAMKLSEEIGNRPAVATILANIGSVYQVLGDYPEALDFLERALKLMADSGDRRGAAMTLLNIGGVYYAFGDYPRALEYYGRALELSKELGDRAGIAMALANSGNVHGSLKDYPKALEHLESALKLKEEIGDRAGIATVLGNLGGVQWSLGNYAKALEHQKRALTLKEELGDRAGTAATLGNIGAVHYGLGDYAKAVEYLERALVEAERVGARDFVARTLSDLSLTHLTRGDPARAITSCRRAVELLGQLATGLADEEGAMAREQFAHFFSVGARAGLALDNAAEVAYFLESGRAMTLLESIGGRKLLEAFVLPEELRRAEAEARAAESVALALYRRALDTGGDVDPLWRKVEGARGRVIEATRRIQREAKAQAALLRPEADSLSTMQGALRPEEALVLYGVWEIRALALVVERGGARLVDLGSGAAILDAATSLQRAMATPDGSVRGVATPGQRATAPAAPSLLLRQLLVDPLKLDAKKRLLVSPDGVLAYVPFAMLFDREVAYVPSGTTYRLLRESEGARGQKVLALGDAVYGHRAGAVGYRGGLGALPATRAEAEAAGDVVLLGKSATLPRLRETLPGQTRWRAVHFACHGLVDPERPALSALALTASGDDDGFLRCLDVYRMRIPADLVVLSACETAQGKVYRAEGAVGFTRAFMYAGAPRVLVSLWKVDDDATRALMMKFYEVWKPGKMPAAAALKAAQEHVRAQERWSHPYFWAAWQLWGLPE